MILLPLYKKILYKLEFYIKTLLSSKKKILYKKHKFIKMGWASIKTVHISKGNTIEKHLNLYECVTCGDKIWIDDSTLKKLPKKYLKQCPVIDNTPIPVQEEEEEPTGTYRKRV